MTRVDDEARRRRWARRIAIAVAGVALLYLLWAIWDREAVMAWLRGAPPLPFFAAMALLPAIGAPLTPLFLLAGATFGARIGLAGTALALAANLAICYWIARSGLRPHLEALLRRFGYELPDLGEPGRSALRFTMLMKLTPGIPGFAKNYALGAAGVPFLLYLGMSMLITGAYAAALIVLGESLLEHDLDRVAIAAGIAVAPALGLWWWSRRRRARARDLPRARTAG